MVVVVVDENIVNNNSSISVVLCGCEKCLLSENERFRY